MVPQPVKAVILLFPITDALETKRKEEDAKTESNDLPAVDPTVIWIKQTVCSIRGISLEIHPNFDYCGRSPMLAGLSDCYML